MGLFLALSMVAVDHAEARRGGSFGSRGGRTFQSAPATNTAPRQNGPVERSMTPNTAQPGAASRQGQNGAAQQQRGGLLGGLGGGLMRGLLIGGLFGMLMGHGFGGMAGMFGMLLQILLIGGLIMLAMRFFRSRSQPSPAYAGAGRSAAGSAPNQNPNWQARREAEAQPQNNRSFPIPSIGGGAASAAAVQSRDIQLDQADLDTFEQRLAEVQAAFSREDHAALRRLVTPEMVSYLSEELAENAQNGVLNEVTDVTLLQADIAESWNEGTQDYATAALRYESRDRLLDRNSGKLVDGDEQLSETTELWTFVRERGADWKLSAIQEA
ncbi:Tim44 domain-containing protein [Tianweitania aestuarii]|nr:Tim44 domain-containing protein [Tianweitania aestuarii]